MVSHVCMRHARTKGSGGAGISRAAEGRGRVRSRPHNYPSAHIHIYIYTHTFRGKFVNKKLFILLKKERKNTPQKKT